MIDFFHSSASHVMPDLAAIDRRLATVADVERALDTVARTYGLRGFLVFTLPSQLNETLRSNVLMTNWPDELVDSYDAASLMQGSPVIDRLRKDVLPFYCDVTTTNRRRGDGKGDIATRLFQRFKLARGVYFPAQQADGKRGAIGFSGEREELHPEEMLQLNMIANYAFNRLGTLRKPPRAGGSSLSERELECLYWAAAGKTSGEMAGILALSEHTVNHYLNRASRKLDAVNRVQAVAKAYRAGFIH